MPSKLLKARICADRSDRYETWTQVPRYLIGLIASPKFGKAGSGLALPMADAVRGCGCLASI